MAAGCNDVSAYRFHEFIAKKVDEILYGGRASRAEQGEARGDEESSRGGVDECGGRLQRCQRVSIPRIYCKRMIGYNTILR